MSNIDKKLTLARWRLVLGKFADRQLGSPDPGDDSSGGQAYADLDRHLDFLYGREYEGRGYRPPSDGREGGDAPSQLTVPEWVQGVRELFPNDTVEILEKHALERYNLTQLVTDPKVLEGMQPSYELLKTLLSFRHLMHGPVLEMARKIIRKTIEEIKEKLARDIRRTLWGKTNRHLSSPLKIARNFNWRRTVRDNLKNYDPESKRLVLERLHFFSNQQHQMRWHVIIAVDCSGSMLDSVIYTSVMAGIFSGLPSLNTSLIAFDTQVVDFTDRVSDPVEVLMSVQLGGGTAIGHAMEYCEGLVVTPHKTIVIVVTDFEEGGSPAGMLASIRRLRESGAKVLGLAALDPEARAHYDRNIAAQCVDAGAEVAALTPNRLAEWLGNVIS